MIIEIKYKDKLSWESVSGNVTDWTNYSKKYKNERVQPFFVAPEIVPDRWNGVDFDVQHLTHDAFSFSMFIKESEVKNIVQMKSCSDIQILEYTENDNGAILNKTYILDLQKSDYFQISEPEKVNNTSAFKVTITFRTNRTIIDKTIPVDNLNYVDLIESDNIFLTNQSPILQSYDVIISLSENACVIMKSNQIFYYQRIGGNWISKGNSKYLGGDSEASITKLTSNRIAYLNGNQGLLTCYEFDGKEWNQVGNYIDIGFPDKMAISNLTENRIAFIQLYGTTGSIVAYDFDGTDFTPAGSAYMLGTIGNYFSIARLADNRCVIYYTGPLLKVLEFNGSTWITESSNSITASSYATIAALSATRIVFSSNYDTDIYIYDYNGSIWTEFTSLISPPPVLSLAALNDFEFVNCDFDTINTYSIGKYRYYSDFDVLNWTKEVDDIKVQWSDGTEKIAQRINKSGYQFLHYLTNAQKLLFIERFKATDAININGITITEVEIEQAEIAIDLYKIVVKGIYETIVNNKTLTVNNTYHLQITNSVFGVVDFYTDYPPELISEAPVINSYTNDNGIATQTKGISKVVKQVKFYLSEAKAFYLKQNFEIVGTKTLDNVPILESREVVPTKLGIDLYEVIVNCVFSAVVNF